MSDEKIKELLPRQYYTLEQAAQATGTDVDYLIHLGATDRLKIYGKFYGEAFYYQLRENESHRKEPIEMDWLDHMEGAIFGLLIQPTLLDLDLGIDKVEVYAVFNLAPTPGGEPMAEQPRFTEWIELSIGPTPGDQLPVIRRKDLWLAAAEVEALKQHIAPDAPPKQTKETRAHAEPGTKSRNAYLRTIHALSQALTKTDLLQQKAAETVLSALSAAGIAPPVDTKTLSNYLKEAADL